MFAQLHARVGDVRTHRRLGAIQLFGHGLSREILDITQQQGHALAPVSTARLEVSRSRRSVRRTIARTIAGSRSDLLRQIFEIGKTHAVERRRKSMAVFVAMRDSQCAAFSGSFN